MPRYHVRIGTRLSSSVSIFHQGKGKPGNETSLVFTEICPVNGYFSGRCHSQTNFYKPIFNTEIFSKELLQSAIANMILNYVHFV